MSATRDRRKITWFTIAGITLVSTVVTMLTGVSSEVRGWFFSGGGTNDRVAQAAGSANPADPIRVSVVAAGSGDPQCMKTRYLLIGGITDVQGKPGPPQAGFGPDETADWFSAHHAIHVVDTIEILVESPQHADTVLHNLWAVVDHWEKPAGALAEVDSPSCGGHLDQQAFTVDLGNGNTAAPIPAIAVPPTGKGFPFTVSETDPDDFIISAKHITGYITWHWELRWTFAGKTETTRIPAGHDEFHSATGPLFCAHSAVKIVSSPKRCPG